MKTHVNRSRCHNNLSASSNSYEVQAHSSLMTITRKLLAINAGEEEEEDAYSLLVGMQAGTARMEISMEGSQKFKDMHDYHVTQVPLFWISSYCRGVLNIVYCSTFLSRQEMESV